MVKLLKLSEGSEADIYIQKILGVEMIIKYRRKKPYLITDIDEDLRKHRTKKEAKMMSLAHSNGVNCPIPMVISNYSIYMNYIKGSSLNKVLDKIKDSEFFEVGKLLFLLHKAGIVHNDFTPANVILEGEQFWLIDFGLAELSSNAEERAIDLLLMKRSVNKKQYLYFAKGYSESNPFSEEVNNRLALIERRGRYQDRSLNMK